MFRSSNAALAALAVIAASASITGCATVTRGTHEAWTVNTTPGGAAVTTSNGRACTATPCTFQMDHRSSFDVTITKRGYQDWHGHVMHEFSSGGGAAFAGNVIVGGGVGMIVDAATGATQKLTPNPLNVTLEPVQAAGAQVQPASSASGGSN
jgi:hypothetical protein